VAQVKKGDSVKVHYTGKLEDGTAFGTSDDDGPIEFTIGLDQVIPGFEEAIIGMEPGEERTARVAADEAYGPYHKELVISVARDEFPAGFQPLLGQELEFRREDGNVFSVTITEVSTSSVTLDGNHPLAGKDLSFEIKLVEIV